MPSFPKRKLKYCPIVDPNPCKIPVVPEGVDFTEINTGQYEATCKQHRMSVVPP
ncbi:hypothetical protein DPMN_192646 [Dreissena polymorpha]|uniref:Uncharacterized protein n=1 Tax=Dreissena polymorpha TaxID=45954 RepID=A0A9D4BFK7_DREPO|nr:hypothetical protein DPMN_192646 [Dreissena polymorpha]